MDSQTQQFYSANSAVLAERYDSCSGGISGHRAEGRASFAEAFTPGSRILDVGCGSGRDLRILCEMGFDAVGVDACEEFVNMINNDTFRTTARQTHGLTDSLSPCLTESPHHCITDSLTHCFTDSLPELATIADNDYDGVLCSAVLMHLPEEELFDASFAIRRILKPHGRLLLSIPLYDETIEAATKRDADGRLFNGVTPEQLQLLFERIGFNLLNRWESPDALNREHRKWATMLFELGSPTGTRPIDTIESILNKDAKVATYKLALFRAFANIATTNYKLARWTNEGYVKIPTEILAEKWIEFYWPIIENGIKQTTGRAIAFRKQLDNLVEYFRNRGGLSAFVLQYRNNKLDSKAELLTSKLLSKLKQTIWNQPVRYAGGGSDFSVFRYDKTDQTVLIGNDIWKELSLMGIWIQDATILRWAELTAKISKNEIKPSEVIDCLLTVPIQERDVYSAKSFYDSLKGKECVWSGKSIANNYHLDHAIPFALWKNNDLWNLLPADAKVNSNKKDKLPEQSVVKARKDCIINYWTLINTKFPARFEYEAAKLTGTDSFEPGNWENKLFATFAEAVEITAIQRGIERWTPANFATFGVQSIYSHNKVAVAEIKENDAEYSILPMVKIAKIVSGGQTGADRGGLDAAIELGIPHGGWCPKGRLSEDGTIPGKYNLVECGAKAYVKRTELNVKDSDATIIFTPGTPTGGSKKTAEFADKHDKPCLIIDTENSKNANIAEILKWLKNLRRTSSDSSATPDLFTTPDKVDGYTLNIAGSRGSKAPGLQKWVKDVMVEVLCEINGIEQPVPDIIYVDFEEIAKRAYIEYLPFVGKLTAGTELFDGFDITDMEKEASEVEWIKADERLCGKNRFIIQVVGDSMEPTIDQFDYVVCEYHRRPYNSSIVIMQPGIAAFAEGESAVKRIKEGENSWIFSSDNTKYEDIIIPHDELSEGYPIIGEVIYNLSKKAIVR